MSRQFDPVFERPTRALQAESDLMVATLSAEIAYWRRRAQWEEERRRGAEQREHGLIAETAQLKGGVEHLRQELASYRRELAEERESLGSAVASLRRRIAEISEETHLVKQRQSQAETTAQRPVTNMGLWQSMRQAAARITTRKPRPARAA